MRIIHFINGRCNPESANGVDKTVYYLSKELARIGNHVSVFSLTSKEQIQIDGVDVRCYHPGKNPFSLPKDLIADLNNFQPDIVHLHSAYIPQNRVLAGYLQRQRIPYVVTPHGGLSRHVLHRHAFLRIPYRFLIELPMLNSACFVHSVCDQVDIKNYGVCVPIVNIPNGFDLKSLPITQTSSYFQKKYPQINNRRIFLFLGRLNIEQKGIDLFLKAFEKVRLPSWCLVIVGPNYRHGKEKILKLVKKLNLMDEVFLSGPLFGNEKILAMESADVFIHTSRWEGMPFSVIEACATGKPCLVTPPASIMGKISEYDAGWVAGISELEIGQKITQICQLTNDDILHKGNNAREMVNREFNWEDIAIRMTEEYERYANY